MVDKEHSNLFEIDKDLIVIFQYWYQYSSHKNYTFKEVEIMDNLTEAEWDYFCNSYICNQTNTKPSNQIIAGTPYYNQESKLEV